MIASDGLMSVFEILLVMEHVLVAVATTLAHTQLIKQGTVPSHCGQVRITVINTARKELAAWLEYVSLSSLF